MDSVVLMRGSAVKDDVIQYEINWGPHVIPFGQEKRFSHRLNLGRGWDVVEVETFIGVDRGNVCEADFQVYDKRNRVLYRRSFHKETLGNYDSFHKQSMYCNPEGEVYIDLSCHGTEKDAPVRWHPLITITLERGELPESPNEEVGSYYDDLYEWVRDVPDAAGTASSDPPVLGADTGDNV